MKQVKFKRTPNYLFSMTPWSADGESRFEGAKLAVQAMNKIVGTKGLKYAVVRRGRLGQNSPYRDLYRGRVYYSVKVEHAAYFDVYIRCVRCAVPAKNAEAIFTPTPKLKPICELNDEELMAFDRRHGGPWDRGSADSYYNRAPSPHYFTGATYSSKRVVITDKNSPEMRAYLAGYECNERFGDKKEYE